TTTHFVPSMLSAFIDVLGPEGLSALSSIRQLFTSGEALAPSVAAAALDALPNVRLHNLYGPTEAAVDVTYHEVRYGDTTVPIGRPVWNTTTRVLDARLHPVPIGVPGELYLGGLQLARGYASRTDLTADRFVADPAGPAGARMYRTGDLVRHDPHGDLEYLGRTDFQVKLRGQRIELGEIEAVLVSAPGVVHAAATVATTADGSEHLVAYLAGGTEESGETGIDLGQVEALAARLLPEYMRPTVWMPLQHVELTASGKLDRRALPAPERGGAEYVAPTTDTE
ncbi:amino acid adenylation domain-containing protein, partial [Streptomyces sp. SID10244]|nr:amino acid adenylation domain-containing protein [Streptomyces sp. SID10244]